MAGWLHPSKDGLGTIIAYRVVGLLPSAPPKPVTAHTILHDAASAVLQRAAECDVKDERSMSRCVAAFNALTGHALTTRDGWMFMVALKAARATATPNGKLDDYIDGAAYFGLAGESVERGMKHINIYGPAASGKTRNADALAKKYGCVRIVDEGKLPPNERLTAGRQRTLLLSRKPIRAQNITNISIEEALK